ncbi:MAG: 4'-phosphopantetheinyl transferase superfamily protein [Actinobacteria bacterium]|nr:4'-phosphopantetheinyl transferase superfamily protein [Actinomycetota bacterium]
MAADPLALPAGECHVWWARPGDATADLDRLLQADERARRRRFAFAADRLRFLAAHALARLVLAEYLGEDPAALRFAAPCRTCGEPHGKPRLDHPSADLEMSLSHSGDRVAVAVARGVHVGIDVEQVPPGADERAVIADALSPAEQRALQEVPSAHRALAFLRCWVRKEALLKATGHGLAVSPALVTVSAPHQPARLIDWQERPAPTLHAQLSDLDPGEGFVACVALLTEANHRVIEHHGAGLLRAAATCRRGEVRGRISGHVEEEMLG